MKGSVRDRIVTIERIFEEPKVMAEKADYSVFSWGILVEETKEGKFCNISGTAKDIESFKDKTDDKFIVDQKTKEKIQEGETYKVYEESTDEAEKYWNVKSFVKIEKDPNLGSDVQLANDAPKESMKDVMHTKGKGSNGGGTCPSPYDRTQTQIVRQSSLNYATQLVGVYYAWALKAKEQPPTLKDMENEIKKIAKEYEEQIMRK